MEKYIVFDIETTGLRPWYGDVITCICARTSEGIEFNALIHEEFRENQIEQERNLISKFLIWLSDKKDFCLISKNGKEFDVPFIMARSVILNVDYDLGFLVSLKHFDIQDVTERRISLQEMATLLGCTPKLGKGMDAIKLYEKGEFDSLLAYCKQDVLTTEEVYKRLPEGLKVLK